ncbi:hypothetical protein [Microbacterium sp. TNHR37B]|uniref:hypothetical protein n=1 Tax=Microbacterium sp. TNHR37B TaxID=1775956 RepID=UPI0007B1954D|nr:hypothetical protein [Microbacterium sp. TNHR37B]KZE91178.1 hypothetical protein AVP41_00713 [Microbacterium sp. TNHR37B]
MPIKIDFVSNTRDLLRGTRDIGNALDDVADALDDVARDGGASGRDLQRELSEVADEAGKTERAARDLGDGVDAGARQGEDSLGRLDRSFRELVDQARGAERAAKDTTDAVDKVGDAGSNGFGRLGEKGAEVSDELRGNLGETFSSFRGDLQDLPQIAQDTLGGLAGSGALGGIAGLAATAAGAAGLGLIIGAFEQIDAANAASQERITEWADRFIEAGGRVLTAGQIIAGANDIITDTEKYKKATEAAELWGVSIETAVLAQAGQPESIKAVNDSLDEQREAFTRAREAGELTYDEQSKALDQLADASSRYRELTDEMDQGSTRAGILSQALRNIADKTEGATSKVDEFGDRVVSLPDGTTIYIDAETGQATQNTDAIEKKIYGIRDKDVRVNVGVEDKTKAEVDRIVRRINSRVATISVNTRDRKRAVV